MHLPGASIRKLGSLVPPPHPGKGTRHDLEAPGPLSAPIGGGAGQTSRGLLSFSWLKWDTAMQQGPGWRGPTTDPEGGRLGRARDISPSRPAHGKDPARLVHECWACALSSRFSSPHPRCSFPTQAPGLRAHGNPLQDPGGREGLGRGFPGTKMEASTLLTPFHF